ncbi:MAG: LVIVD repeat-containing protein [Alphaproteobacteria bacterium]
MATSDLLTPDFARNMRILGHSDQGGRADGIQVMVSGGYAYVGHVFTGGFSVIDVRDPRQPAFVRHVPQPVGTWSQHLQTHGDILIVNNMKDMLQDENINSGEYYQGSIGDKVDLDAGDQGYAAGMRVYDISDRANPREIAFLEIPGLGVHRVWYDGGDWAYISALPPGFTDDIFMIVDFSEPTRPEPVSRLWLPGMNAAAGETPSWDPKYRYALHHAIVKGDLACGAWRDGGVTTMDVSDRHNPRILSYRNPCPPFAGGTHNTLALPDRNLLVVVEEAVFDNCEDGVKRNWVYDIREPSNPVSIATMPIPDEVDYVAKGGQFGPHNIHENRSEGFQSSDLVFITYQNAGLRVYDISNPYRPEEVAALVPPAPTKLMDYRPDRPLVVDTTDVYVDRNGLIYTTDMNAGLYIMEMENL